MEFPVVQKPFALSHCPGQAGLARVFGNTQADPDLPVAQPVLKPPNQKLFVLFGQVRRQQVPNGGRFLRGWYM